MTPTISRGAFVAPLLLLAVRWGIADKYLFTVFGAGAGSSRFGSGPSYGSVPGVAWRRLSDEQFLETPLPIQRSQAARSATAGREPGDRNYNSLACSATP